MTPRLTSKLVATRNFKPAPTLSDALLDTLPEPLRVIKNKYEFHFEKELFFLSAMTALGGIMPRVWALYTDQKLYPSQYLCAWGPFGSGKSVMGDGKRIVAGIDDQMLEQTEALKAAYQVDREAWERNKAVAAKQNREFDEDPPTKPPENYLVMAANITSAAFYRNLAMMEIPAAIYYASEIDTLLANFASEYGDFSDVIRLAYEHATLSKSNTTGGENGGGREYRIKEPRLTFMVSGTEDQVARLLKGRGAQNGLMSRMFFYRTPNTDTFKPVLLKTGKYELFARAQEWAARLHRWLGGANVEVVWQDGQNAAVMEYFGKYKIDGRQRFNDDYHGFIHRLAICWARWAIIFTILEYYDDDPDRPPPSQIYCSETAFASAIEVTEINRWYLEDAVDTLVMGRKSLEQIDLKPKQKKVFLALPDSFEPNEAIEIGKAYGVARRTVFRLLANEEYFTKTGTRYFKLISDENEDD